MERDERYEVNSKGEIVVGTPVTLTPSERKDLIQKMFSKNGWKYTVLQEISQSHFHIRLENNNLDFAKDFHLYHGNIRNYLCRTQTEESCHCQQFGLDRQRCQKLQTG